MVKKYVLLLAFLSIFSVSWAQIEKDSISISFENRTRVDVLKSLASENNLELYYLPQWFSSELISGRYDNLPLSSVLDSLLKDTSINYFLFEGEKLILTRNNVIYKDLPEGFFGVEEEEEVKEPEKMVQPIFYTDFETTSSSSKIETVRIGRANRIVSASEFKLSGYIKNVETGEPIPDLSIVTTDRNTGTVTDSNGYYEINLPPGATILEFRAIGIENTRKRVYMYNSGTFDVQLNESLNQLDEVVLEANFNRNVEETTTGKEEIDVEKSKNIPLVLGERDVLKVATALPGISTAGEGSAGFNVRGGQSDQNLILFDDAVVYNPQHFFGIFSAINPFAISQLDVYKGSIPAEYGGRLSSVFDIQTKNGNTENFSGEASVGPVTSNVVLEVPVVANKSSLMVGGRAAYANWILNSLDEESLRDSEASFYDVLASYHHKINESNSLKATTYLSRDDFSITSDSLYIYNNQVFSLKWNHQFNAKNSASLLLTHSGYDFNIEFDEDSEADFLLGYDIKETGLKLKFNTQKSVRLQFDYGLEGKLYNISPGRIEPLREPSNVQELTIAEEQGLESAAFLSAQLKATQNLSIEAGIRYSFFAALGASQQRIFRENAPRNESNLVDTLNFDKNELIETYGGPEFRLAARYLLGNNFAVKASYNNTIQYLHRLSNNTTVSPIDTWKLSDLNIKPQRGQQFSLGFFKNLEDNNYEISLEGFYKNSDNALDFKTGAQLLLNENIETEVLQGKAKSYGLEFLVRKNSGRLNGWLGYTYSRSLIQFASEFAEEQINDGVFFPSNYDKPHDLSLVANYKFTRRFSLSTNFVYQTGRPVTIPVGNFNFNNAEYAAFSDRNSFRIPDFYRLDLGFNIEGNHKLKKFAHSFWTISIYNVLGRNNPFSVFFVTEDSQVKALKSSIFSIPVPAITYNFKF